MLKYEYKIMHKIATIKILGLSKLVKEQNIEINRLKAENEILKAGNKYNHLVEIIPSRTEQINTIA